MTVAQGTKKTTAIIKQSGLGTPGSGAGSQALRRVTSVFTKNTATFDNNEIVSHQQSTGVAYGLKSVDGKINGLLSPATYKLLFASAMRKDFAAGATTGALTNVTAATTTGAQGTFTRAAGSYLTDGFKIGDVIRWTGWATTGASNNSVNMLIIALTATVMTVTRFDTTAIGAKASGDSVTATVVGKKTLAPLTGHTNDYFTIEEWYSDLTKSELFTDCKITKIDVGLPASGNSTFAAQLAGLARTKGTAQVLTSPTAATSTPVVTGANGLIFANGAIVVNVTGVTISIDDTTQLGDAVAGSTSAQDLSVGRIKVSGQLTALFSDTVLSDLYDSQTALQLVVVLMANTSSATSSFISFNMSRIKLTGDAPDDGEKNIIRTLPFVAEIDVNGGAALATDNTIMSIQDSDA